MQISSASVLGLLLLGAAAWSASSVSCASIGSGCIRNSDCSSGQVCVASTCQVDPGSLNPQEAGAELEASPAQESATLPPPVDSSVDKSVIVPSPDANSSDVSTDTSDARDASDAPSEALDAASDAPDGD